MRPIFPCALGLALVSLSAQASLPAAAFAKRPKLVVVVVVDQFRADYLVRFQKRFGQGGYNELISKGAYYPFAHYSVLQSMTGPGHAMILSGSLPYQNGISLNLWQQDGKPMYCAADESAEIVGIPPQPPLEGKPSGKVPPRTGMSPRNLNGDTLGDELKNAGYPSRVVTVALKDRSAIMMGGHRADLALWFDAENFRWVSSKHYLPQGKLPDWVQSLNAEVLKKKGQNYEWKVTAAPTGFTLGGAGEFVHNTVIGGKESLSFPLGMEMTVDAAERALASYDLGKGKSTDLLAVSLSSHDYMAHAYGPNTRELEEMTVAEDRLVARLLATIKKRMGGMNDVVVAFTADHGGPPSPQWLRTTKLKSGYIDGAAVTSRIEARLIDKFGKPAHDRKWVSFGNDLNFWLDSETLADKKLARDAVEAEAKLAALGDASNNEGIAYVFTQSDYLARRLPPGQLERHILRGYYPGRSGDVVIVPKPFFFEDGDPVGHMTGYAYDRTVPLILMGARLKPGVYAEDADVIDLAPTLSFLLGTIPPSLSEGRVLSEAIGAK
jgi:predicted AlkP superfamily pyrophosphatase or phosphodiesterase